MNWDEEDCGDFYFDDDDVTVPKPEPYCAVVCHACGERERIDVPIKTMKDITFEVKARGWWCQMEQVLGFTHRFWYCPECQS